MIRLIEPFPAITGKESFSRRPAEADSRLCFYCGIRKHGRVLRPAKERICHTCDKKGHFARVCNSRRRIKSAASANVVSSSDRQTLWESLVKTEQSTMQSSFVSSPYADSAPPAVVSGLLQGLLLTLGYPKILYIRILRRAWGYGVLGNLLRLLWLPPRLPWKCLLKLVACWTS